MKRPYRTRFVPVMLSVALGSLPLAPIGLAAAPAADPDQDKARALYSDGQKAYRLGNFSEAVKQFEEAYALSSLPALLYNVGLAYTRLYEVSNSLGDLRKAKAVLKNFQIEIRKDPSLGDEDEVQQLLTEIDEKLAAGEEAERVAAAERAKLQAAEGPRPEKAPKGPDPGKKQRIAGIAVLGAGGLLALGGAAIAVSYGLAGQRFREELSNNKTDQNDLGGCNGGSPPAGCQALKEEENTITDNGRLANTMVATGGVIAGVGVAAIVAGAVVLDKGLKRTQAWEQAGIRLVPTGRGFALVGRF